MLLLDEPLSALDATIRRHLRQQIRELQQELNLTTIFVTHDQEEALMISDRVFLMNKGNIEQSGAPEEIYTRPVSSMAAEFMGTYNFVPAEHCQRWFNQESKNGVAVRAEAIVYDHPSLRFDEQVSAPIAAQITEKHLLGNVIRCKVQTDDLSLTVDSLNNQFLPDLTVGLQVSIRLDPRECVTLAR